MSTSIATHRASRSSTIAQKRGHAAGSFAGHREACWSATRAAAMFARLLLELGQLGLRQRPPRPARHEPRDLVEGEADLAQEQDDRDLLHRVVVVTPLPTDRARWADEPEFVVVAQRGDRHPRALGQLPDRQDT